MIVVAGGEVLTANGWVTTDVAIEGGIITEIAPDIRGAERIDASGCFVGPGLVDLHVHFREPGQVWKEDIESGSRAASAGGFTAVVAMPNTEPAMDNESVIAEVSRRGREVGIADIVPAAALTIGRNGKEVVDLESLYELGIRVFSDDGDSVEDEAVTREIMTRLADLPEAVMAQHAEIKEMTVGGHMHGGGISRSLGMGALPSEAEVEQVRRDLELVAATGAPYHCQHVSAAGTLELIREAKQSGLPVTAEVTPHHLFFTDEQVASLDTDYKMYPPLRTPEDRDALVDGLTAGVIDCVATDHAPHTVAEKSVPFEDAPRGVIGLETAASATWSVLSDIDRLFETLGTAPRKIAALPERTIAVGATADIVVFDPNQSWVPQQYHSKASNSPFTGQELKGRVLTTIYRGEVTYG